MSNTMRRIVLASRPSAAPEPANFRLEEVALPEPGPGEVLVKVEYMSLDPYMRGRMSAAKSYATPVEIGKEGIVKNFGLGEMDEFEKVKLGEAIQELIPSISEGVDFIAKQ